MIIFADSRDPIFNSRGPNRIPKTSQKTCFIINFFRPSGSSKLLLYSWFVVLNGICVCCVG